MQAREVSPTNNLAGRDMMVFAGAYINPQAAAPNNSTQEASRLCNSGEKG